jgi:hypothetical protein
MILKFSSQMKATVTCSLLFSPLVLMLNQAYEVCPSISKEENCPAGCWLPETEIDFPFAVRQCSSVGYGYFSKGYDNTRQACPPGTFSDSLNAQVCQQCETGAYAPSVGSRFCDLCPAGSFSGIRGSDNCRSCLDDYYKQSGANAVEFWEGQYYCTYIGSPTTFSATPSELEPTSTPTTLLPTAPSMVRSKNPTSAPSSTSNPSSTPSPLPLTNGIVVSLDDHLLLANTTLLQCNDIEGQFEWHGRCKQCPSTMEEGLYPFLIFISFGALLTALQSLVPLCSTSTVWIGIEYFQVLYLISLCGISWSPMADVIFQKVVPGFALDFSANFNLQCIFGWPNEYDQVFTITLPLIFWIFVIAFSKLSPEPLVAYKSGLRWLIVYLYLGFASILQTSNEACDLYTIFTTLTSRLPLTNWFTVVAGVMGLMCYGLVFPYLFHRALRRYYEVVVLGIEEENQDESKHDDIKTQATCSCLGEMKKAITDSDYENLFFTLGIFPSIRESASWWPLFWMIRKIGFIVLVANFPRSPFLLLVLLLVILFLSEIFQRCVAPFPNKCEERMGNKWFHSTKVDTVLQVCAVAMVGLNFLIVGSDGTRTTAQDLTMDSLVLGLLGASVVFWLLALGFASATSCEDCPRFATLSKQLLGKRASSHEVDDEASAQGDWALEEVSLDDTPLGIRSAKLPLSERSFGRKKWSPNNASIPPTIAMLWQTGLYGEEINLGGNDREVSTQSHYQHDPVISFIDYDLTAKEHDMERLLNEQWIDSETGKDVHFTSSGKWTDVETERRVAKENQSASALARFGFGS